MKEIKEFVKKHFRFLLFFRIRFQMLHVFESENDCDWYVGYDEMDALKAQLDETDIDLDMAGAFNLVPDAQLFTINDQEAEFESDLIIPFLGKTHYEPMIGWQVTAPAWAWALQNGRGFLCSTEY